MKREFRDLVKDYNDARSWLKENIHFKKKNILPWFKGKKRTDMFKPHVSPTRERAISERKIFGGVITVLLLGHIVMFSYILPNMSEKVDKTIALEKKIEDRENKIINQAGDTKDIKEGYGDAKQSYVDGEKDLLKLEKEYLKLGCGQ